MREKFKKAIIRNGWDNGNTICYYHPKSKEYQGELDDAINSCMEITKAIMVEFADFIYEEPNFTKWGQGKIDSEDLLEMFLKQYEQARI